MASSGSGRPANTPAPSWRISEVLPCITCGGSHDPPAEDLADALQAEAHAEHRATAGEVADHVVAEPRIVGRAGARGDEHGVGIELDQLVEGPGVVAVHERLGPQLTEVLDEVVDERVVVVDDQHPGAHGRRRVVAGGPFPPAFRTVPPVGGRGRRDSVASRWPTSPPSAKRRAGASPRRPRIGQSRSASEVRAVEATATGRYTPPDHSRAKLRAPGGCRRSCSASSAWER